MKLEQQVVSLELAKKLKELGVSQQSLFWWEWYITTEIKKSTDIPPKIVYLPNKPSTKNKPLRNAQHYPAYTVSELGEMLPTHFHTIRCVNLDEHHYECLYPHHQQKGNPHFKADTEADARAKMLIYLIENNLIKV